jgi:site-specific recombinase XerD
VFLAKAAEWHMLAAKASQKSADTLHSYEQVHRQYGAFVSSVVGEPATVAHLTLELARAWQVHLGERGLSATTIYHYSRTLKTWSKWLVDEFATSLPGVFPQGDPLARLTCPRRDDREPSVLNRDQIELLVAYCQMTRDPLRNAAMLLLMVESGLRNNEVCHVRRDAVEYATSKDSPGQIRVFGKGRKERRVGFGWRASRAMQAYAATERGSSDSPYLFLNHYGQVMSPAALRKLCAVLRDKTQIVTERVHPHALRHSFANLRAEAGQSIIAIQNQLGHSRLEQTRRYTRRALVDLDRNYLSVMDQPPKRKEPRS